jgi:hypothetical protein
VSDNRDMETFDLPASIDELESKEEAIVSHDRVEEAPAWYIQALLVVCVRFN